MEQKLERVFPTGREFPVDPAGARGREPGGRGLEAAAPDGAPLGESSGRGGGEGGGERKRLAALRAVAIALGVALMAAVAMVAWLASNAGSSANIEHEPGAYVIPQGDMTDEEAQALVDEITESSRITVSVAGAMELASDGKLRVNFVVPEDNNGLSERLEVEQDGRIVYRSGVIEPGFMVEWVSVDGAVPGDATATVYAVNSEGVDSGNPASVEVEIVAAESSAAEE